MVEDLDALDARLRGTEEGAHSPLGASGASRWMKCPGSFRLSLKVPPEPGSAYAEMGTAAHELAEHCLNSSKQAWEFYGRKFRGFVIGTGEGELDPRPVDLYVDYVNTAAAGSDLALYEYQFALPRRFFWGTSDAVIVHPDRLEVVDLKFGEGIVVNAEANVQLMYYAAGAIQGLEEDYGYRIPDDLPVKLTICQPRRPDNELSHSALTVGYIRQWRDEQLLPAMDRAETEDTLVSGEHCRFCPAILICSRARDAYASTIRGGVDMLSDEELDALYTDLPLAKKFTKALENKVESRLKQGATITSAKLVKGASYREWKDTAGAALVEILGEDAYERKIKSPSQVEKISQKMKDFVAEYAFKPESPNLRLAHIDDKGQAVSPTDLSEAMLKSMGLL